MIQATPQILDDLNCYLPDRRSTEKIARFFALSNVLKMNQTTVSHQLRILKDMDVVACERDGKVLKYKISNPKINEILLIGVEYLGF